MVSSCGLLQPVSMKKLHRSNGSLPLHLPPPKGRPQADLCSTVKRPTPGLRALPPMTAQIATALGPALDEPGALQQPSTVHVSEGSITAVSSQPALGLLHLQLLTFALCVSTSRSCSIVS